MKDGSFVVIIIFPIIITITFLQERIIVGEVE